MLWQEKVGSITSDNATCNDTMMHQMQDSLQDLGTEWDAVQHRTRCFGHQINLSPQALFAASTSEADFEVDAISGTGLA